MVPVSQVILFVGLLCELLLTQFANCLTTHIDHLGLNLGPTFEIKCQVYCCTNSESTSTSKTVSLKRKF